VSFEYTEQLNGAEAGEADARLKEVCQYVDREIGDRGAKACRIES
jgi:hypothetical protein